MNELIELTLPAMPDYLYLARLHVGAVAARIDMTVEEVEDLHLAVGELCLTLLGPAGFPDTRLRLDIQTEEDSIRVDCHLLGDVGDSRRPVDGNLPVNLSRRILDALVDDHGSTEGAAPTAWLQKRRERTVSAS